MPAVPGQELLGRGVRCALKASRTQPHSDPNATVVQTLHPIISGERPCVIFDCQTYLSPDHDLDHLETRTPRVTIPQGIVLILALKESLIAILTLRQLDPDFDFANLLSGPKCAALYCATNPSVRGSSGLRFKTWTGAYPKLTEHFASANLNPADNKWDKV